MLYTLTYNIEYTLNILTVNIQPRTIHILFLDLKIGYDIVQTCAHACIISHYIDS